MDSLHIYANADTDKFDLGYVDAFYDPLFVPKKETVSKVLEIGVCYGGSVKLWRDFFNLAHVYGVDVGDMSFLNAEPRITCLGTTNGYDVLTVEHLKGLEPDGFDVVIDDGPHTLESMQFFLSNYLQLVKSGGILVLEDIIDTSWTPSLVSLIDPSVGKVTVIDMRDKIRSEELKARWANGLDVIVVEKY